MAQWLGCAGWNPNSAGYLDAIVDRYQELIVLVAIGWVTGLWVLALLAFSGAMITSYAKARAAIEIPVENAAWPDAFERLERIILLCALLILAGLTGVEQAMAWSLAIYAVLCHATALQRVLRAVRLLRRADQDKS